MNMRWTAALAAILSVSATPIVVSVPAVGQDDAADEGVDGRIVGRIWHTRFNPQDSFRYMTQLRKELGMTAGGMLLMMPSPQLAMGMGMMGGPQLNVAGREEVATKGLLLFLQTKPQVALDQSIAFMQVESIEEFHNLLKQHAERHGPAGELIGDDDQYEFRLHLRQLMAATTPPSGDGEPDGDAPAQPRVRSFAITIRQDIVGSSEGTPAPEPPSHISTYYRYVDGIVYSSSNAALFRLDLPTRTSLQLEGEEAEHSLYADIDLTEIPIELKREFWNTLESSTNTYLQRFDDEALGAYSLRRAMGTGKLEVLKAALFDIDRVRFWLRLPENDAQELTAQLKVTARANSPLATTLGQISDHTGQLSGLIAADAPLAVASTVQLPNWARPFATGFVESLRLRLHEAVNDPAQSDLIDNLVQPLEDSVAGGLLESAVWLDGSVEDGLTLTGAARLEGAEQFLLNLETLLLVRSAGHAGYHVERTSIGDYAALRIIPDALRLPDSDTQIPMEIHLCAAGSRLYFASGGHHARDVLTELVRQIDAPIPASRDAVPLVVRFRLDRWLGESNDEFSHVPAEVLTRIEQWFSRVTRPRFTLQINGSDAVVPPDDGSPFTSYVETLLTPENARFELTVRSAPREFVADARIGTGLLKFVAAQYLQSQQSMFRGLNLELSPGGGQGVQRIQLRQGPDN